MGVAFVQADDLAQALGEVRSSWQYQPMNDEEAWTRLLRLVTRPNFDSALDVALNSGFKRRPSAGEFGAIVSDLRARRQPAVRDTRNPEPWPEVTPDDVSRHVAACKSLVKPTQKGTK